jgi:hypothetical protein
MAEGSESPLAEGVRTMNEGEPVWVPQEVFEGLEAVHRYIRGDVVDIPTVRYLAQERG